MNASAFAKSVGTTLAGMPEWVRANPARAFRARRFGP